MKTQLSTLGIVLLTLLTINLLADNVKMNDAKTIGKNYYWENSRDFKPFLYDQVVPELLTTETLNGTSLFYIFNINRDDGFIIVAADDDVIPVLGYSFTGSFPENVIPPAMEEWLQSYKDQIAEVIDRKIDGGKETEMLWEKYKTYNPSPPKSPSVAPLLTTIWNQDDYYNDLCPYDISGPNNHAFAGCVATAMGQVMKYWAYPVQGTGNHSYLPSTYPSYGIQSADFAATEYDYSLMPNSINSGNIQVATLLYHCGVSVDMNYGPTGSSPFGSNWALNIENALKNNFNYSPSLLWKWKNNYSVANWITLLKAELDNNRPMIYYGWDGSNQAHCFNCDGFRSSDNFFHFNWGWSGVGNGYYSVTALNPGYNFTLVQGAIFDMYPPKIIYVDENATGLNNGKCWRDAFFNLDVAITSAQPGYSIWVAKGTYSPTGNGIGRYRHFQMKNDVKIYGGFEGTENPGIFNLYDRNLLANETILDGEGDRLNVVYNLGINSTALLDGFSVTGGWSSDCPYETYPETLEQYSGAGMHNLESNPVIQNCRFYGNSSCTSGGGMYNKSSSPAIYNSVLYGNITNDGGGGMFNLLSNPQIVNCVFSGNKAIQGGAICNDKSNCNIFNSTIAGNLALWTGGGICNVYQGNSTVVLQNSIVWSNEVLWDNNGDFWGHQIFNEITNTCHISNSCVAVGGNFNIYGPGNINWVWPCLFVDPQFVLPEPAVNAPTVAGNYRLQVTSPAKDAGDNLLVPVGITLDLDWNPRIAFFTVDMGAYESPEDCLPPKNLAAKNITDVSADLFWTPGGSETQWNIEIGLFGFAQGTGILFNNIPAVPFPLNGLTPSTTYEFYVQAVCNAGVVSNWAGPKSFTTNSISLSNYDFGDAPDPGYPTLLPLGANHLIVPSLFLGYIVDPETDGLPHPFAIGDDLDGTNDEDGIKFLNSLVPGQMANLEIQVTGNGFLNGWIDFDGNGSWAEPDNQIMFAYPVVPGLNLFSFLVQPTAVPGATFARFRLSSAQGLSYDGTAPDGEVEDYRVFIHQPVDHKMHFPQYPDLNGWDVNITEPNLAADDFQCSKTGPVDNIYFWISMKGDAGAFELDACIDWINVSIHADIPAYQSTTGYSMPSDPPLWEKYFVEGDYTWSHYFQHPQNWYSPFDNLALIQDHEHCFKINIENIENPFVQTNGVIYWVRISIHSRFPGIEFGWETSLDKWNDAATWNYPFGSYLPLTWNKLTDPLSQESLDLAFYINNDPASLGQILQIPQGWSGISTWLDPQPADIALMFAPCVNNLVVVKSGIGIYWPAQNVNTIGNWDVEKGYSIKMNSDVTLQVNGQKPSSTDVFLNVGWNLVPVLSTVPVDIATVLSSLPCVVVAKGIPTGVYWPGYNINTIGSLEPGSAYWVYTTCACTLTYPPSPPKGSVPVKSVGEKEIASPWNKVVKTQSSHLIIVPATSNEISLQNLNLGAFTTNGTCVGITEITSENTVISIYADDPTTPEIDGMMDGEEIMLRIFDPEKGTDIPLNPVFDASFADADGKFRVNGLSMVDVKTSLPENETDMQVSLYPNPANNFVNIEVAGTRFSDATILFYDLTGQVVLQTTFQEVSVTRIETNPLPAGIYQVVVQSEGDRISRKLVIK